MNKGLVKLSFNYTCFTTRNKNETKAKLNYFKGDYAAIRQCLDNIEYSKRANIVQVCKILLKTDKVDKEKLFQMAEYTTTRGHSLKL